MLETKYFLKVQDGREGEDYDTLEEAKDVLKKLPHRGRGYQIGSYTKQISE